MAGMPMMIPGMMPGGGAPGMGGPPGGGAPGAGGPPDMAGAGASLARFLGQQGGEDKTIEQEFRMAMLIVGKLLQRFQFQNPKTFQQLLRAQTALSSALTSYKEHAAQQHPPLASVMAQMLSNVPGQKPIPY